MDTSKKVTVVLTSCNRVELLDKTIESFHSYNTYPIEEFIIIEDSTDIKAIEHIKSKYSDYTLIFNEENIGTFKSIDKAYSQVSTPYVFHLEDDWKFVKEGFIEDSMKILDYDSKVINVWIRALTDTMEHPFSEEKYSIDDIGYYIMETDYGGYTGFTTNPGLRRLVDHNQIGGLGKFGPRAEILAGQEYLNLGFYAVILEHKYIEHTGWNNSAKNHPRPRKKRNTFI